MLANDVFAGDWRAYTRADGLPTDGCRSVTVAEDGSILAVSTDSKTFYKFDGYEIKSYPAPPGGAARVSQSPAGQFWTATPQGLWTSSGYDWKLYANREAAESIAICPVKQKVVFCLLPERLIEFNADNTALPKITTLRSNVQTSLGRFVGMTVGSADELWVVGEKAVARVAGPKRAITSSSEWQEFPFPSERQLSDFSEPKPDFSGFTVAAKSKSDHRNMVVHFDGEKWDVEPVDAGGNRFAWRDMNGNFWASSAHNLASIPESPPTPTKERATGTYNDVAVDWRGTFWLATTTGLLRYTPELWRGCPPPANAPAAKPVVAKSFASVPGLTNAEVTCSLVAQTGDIWLGGDFGTAWRHDHWTIFPASEGNSPTNVLYLIELPNGRIWCASTEKIWSFDGRAWSLGRGALNQLDSLVATRDGSIWAGTASGIERWVRGKWIEYSLAEGLDSPLIETVWEDPHGTLMAKTAGGWFAYHPEDDSDPPRTFIDTVANPLKIPEREWITLSFGGVDKWQITPGDRLMFAHRLDNEDWTTFDSATNVVLSDLPPGKHYFQVHAMDRAGNIDPDAAHLEFAIVPPWYEESRLLLTASLGGMTALFFAGLAYKRHRQLQQSYRLVEKQVIERTRQLEAASHELVQSQKMRALGTLSAGIAHDFNNILSIIKGSAQIIEDNPGNPGKIRTRLDRIKTMVDQGSAVVQAMLGFSRGSDENFEPCEINPIVDNTIKLLGDRFLRDVEIQFDRGAGLPPARTSQSLVQQILLNFIFNAAESMAGRKKIVITTAAASPAMGMILPPGKSEAWVSVSVRDSGGGISPENLARVFEPFFTTKALSTRRGTGLGLSVVYELAKKMGAGLAVESVLGQGSVFTLILPAVKVEKTAAADLGHGEPQPKATY